MYCRIFFSYVLISQISASFSWKHFKILSQKRRWGAWALKISNCHLKRGLWVRPIFNHSKTQSYFNQISMNLDRFFFFLEFNLDLRFEKPIKSTNDNEALNSLHLKLKLFYVHKFYSKYCE